MPNPSNAGRDALKLGSPGIACLPLVFSEPDRMQNRIPYGIAGPLESPTNTGGVVDMSTTISLRPVPMQVWCFRRSDGKDWTDGSQLPSTTVSRSSPWTSIKAVDEASSVPSTVDSFNAGKGRASKITRCRAATDRALPRATFEF